MASREDGRKGLVKDNDVRIKYVDKRGQHRMPESRGDSRQKS